jgi:hypothetical protein
MPIYMGAPHQAKPRQQASDPSDPLSPFPPTPTPPQQPPNPTPQILTKQVERDMLPVLSALSGMGCSPSDLQLLVWEFPRIFTSSNWRRHVRKFQYLGLYGLPPPGHSRTGSSKESSTSSSAGSGTSSGVGSSTGSVWEHSTDSSTDSLDRLMRWI